MSRELRERMVGELADIVKARYVSKYVQLSLDSELLLAAAANSRIAVAYGQKPQDVPGLVEAANSPNVVLCQEIGANTPNLHADKSIDILYIPGSKDVAMILSKMWHGKAKVMLFDAGVGPASGHEFFTEVNLARRSSEAVT